MLLLILSLVASVYLNAVTVRAYGCSDIVVDGYRGDRSMYGEYNGNCIRFQIYKKMNYISAQLDCARFGGTLVMPKTKEFNTYLLNKLNLYTVTEDLWIGLSDRKHEGSFVWVDNTNVGSQFFASGEGYRHTLKDEEDCVVISAQAKGWKDEVCSKTFDIPKDNKNAYICQYPPTKG